MLLSLIQCCFHCGSIFIIDLLAVKFLQEFSEVYNEDQVLPIFPSTTKWTSHGRAFKALYEGYQAHIGALTVFYKKRKEPKGLGIFLAITLEIFIITYATQFIQSHTSSELSCPSRQRAALFGRCQDLQPSNQVKLENLQAGETKWFKEENFDDMVRKTQQQRLSLSPSARLQSADTSFGWERYATNVFKKFLSAFIVQFDDAF